MSILSGLFAKYGDDIARKFVDHADDAVLAGIRNYSDDALRAAANQADDLARVSANNVDDIFYHGTPNGGFKQFNDGSYFTKNKKYADSYQNPLASDISFGKKADNPMTYQVKLHNKMPFDISDDAARQIYIDDYIKGGNATGINPYQPQSFYDNIKDIDWTEVEGLKDFLIDNGYGYDSIIANEGGYFDDLGNVVPRGQSVLMFNGKDVEIMPNTLSQIVSDENITPLYRGQKYGVNDLLYNKNGGGTAGAGATPSVSNAYYFTPNAEKTGNWIGENGGTIQIPMRNDDVITLQQLQDMIAEAEPIFADPRKALDLYNTNPTRHDLLEAVADRQYRTISELTGKPFIQPDSGQGQELLETLFFPDTNPTLTDIYRELLRRSGGKPI